MSEFMQQHSELDLFLFYNNLLFFFLFFCFFMDATMALRYPARLIMMMMAIINYYYTEKEKKKRSQPPKAWKSSGILWKKELIFKNTLVPFLMASLFFASLGLWHNMATSRGVRKEQQPHQEFHYKMWLPLHFLGSFLISSSPLFCSLPGCGWKRRRRRRVSSCITKWFIWHIQWHTLLL